MNRDRAWIEVSLSALKNNLIQIQNHVGSSKIMGVVKDNFYGLGTESIKALETWGVDFFSVSTMDEAIALRQLGIKSDVLILGYTNPHRFHQLQQYDLQQTIVSPEFYQEMVNYGLQHTPLKGQIKINTGMNRLGIKASDRVLIQAILSNPACQITGIFSHLLAADEFTPEAKRLTQLQIQRYQETIDYCQSLNLNYGMTHLLNSYGSLFYGETAFDYVRPGISFVGCPDVAGFKNVIKVKSTVAMVKQVQKGEQLGYGAEHKAPHDMRVATITIGYGDGLLRHLNKTGHPLMLDGKICHLIGRMCMDQSLIDVSHLPNVKAGDIVEIISDEYDVFHMARELGTIANELLCHLNARLPKVLVE